MSTYTGDWVAFPIGRFNLCRHSGASRNLVAFTALCARISCRICHRNQLRNGNKAFAAFRTWQTPHSSFRRKPESGCFYCPLRPHQLPNLLPKSAPKRQQSTCGIPNLANISLVIPAQAGIWLLLLPFVPALAAEFATEIGAETTPSICGIPHPSELAHTL